MIPYTHGQTLLGLGLSLCLTLLPATASAEKRQSFEKHKGSTQHTSHPRKSQSGSRRIDHPRRWQRSARHRPHHSICKVLAARLEWHEAHGRSSSAHDAVYRFLAPIFGCEAAEPATTIAQAPPPLATLVDADSVPFADLGLVEASDSLVQVTAASSFVEPIVILGPATRRDPDPGVLRLESADSDGFLVRFREWNYLDGEHAAEAVSYLILAPGRHVLPDGSEWEIGSIEVSEASTFFAQSFNEPFPEPPLLFLSVQAQREEDPVVVRARDVTEAGFETAIMEEDGADGLHGNERIGYLAVSSPAGSGELLSASNALPYLVRRVVAGHLSVPILSGSLAMQEESSVDVALDHPDETLAYLAIGAQVFAQAMTTEGISPASVRRTAPGHGADLEWGTVDRIDDLWHTIPLAREYDDPVVVVGPVSRVGPEPGVLRVRNVRANAFEVRFQEWDYLDGTHLKERLFYLVADRGIQSLAGLILEAGYTDSSAIVREGLQDISFALPFPAVPGVFASVMTENDPQPVTLRISGRTPLGFRMALQAEEASTEGHGVERLGWIAIQTGEGTTPDGRTLRVFDTVVDHRVATVPLGAGLSGRFPTVLGQIVSLFGFDPVTLRFQDATSDSIGLVAAEEKSKDAEIEHVNAEEVSVFVAE